MPANLLHKVFLATFVAVAYFVSMNYTSSEAHIPYLSKDEHFEAETALPINDIHISKAIYQTLSESRPTSWIKFYGSKKEDLYVQIGVPKILDLEDFRPSLYLIKPSSPKKEVTSTSSKLIDTSIKTPRLFHEPYSDTHSWVFGEITLELPEDGTYYLVSIKDEIKVGKLWVAIGKEESFGISDMGRLPSTITEVRKFHSSLLAEKDITSQNKPQYLKYVSVLSPIALIFLFTGSIFIWRKKRRLNISSD
ncbi:MAG: hypothetical protein ACJ0BL_05420 [Dehalococcoidia bacterium]